MDEQERNAGLELAYSARFGMGTKSRERDQRTWTNYRPGNYPRRAAWVPFDANFELAAPSERSLRRHFSRDHFIHVAPYPTLSGFDGADERMSDMVEVLGRMLVLRGIAATDMAAYHAQTQVNPGIAHFHALFADM